eukprot:UN00843
MSNPGYCINPSNPPPINKYVNSYVPDLPYPASTHNSNHQPFRCRECQNKEDQIHRLKNQIKDLQNEINSFHINERNYRNYNYRPRYDNDCNDKYIPYRYRTRSPGTYSFKYKPERNSRSTNNWRDRPQQRSVSPPRHRSRSQSRSRSRQRYYQSSNKSSNRYNNNNNSSYQFTGNCYRCGEIGHRARDCTNTSY